MTLPHVPVTATDMTEWVRRAGGAINWLLAYNANAVGVDSFNTRVGAVTLLSADVTSALGYTPATNARTIAAGNGLTGGGDLSADRTFDVGAGAGISVTADAVGLDTASTRNTDHAAVSISPGTGLSGGGDLTTTRTLSIANTTVTGGSYGSSSQVGTFTVNGQGQLTAAGNVTITPAAIGAVPTSRILTAGSGLTGGGDLSADRTFDVGAGTGITVNANDVALDTTHVRNVDHSAVTITAGAGLAGGGTIEATRTLDVGAGTGITVNANDVALDTSSARNTDHSGVTLTAGAGLTGGGDISASRSFAVGAGTGITVNADDVAIDTSVVVTLTGSQTLTNKTLTAPTVSGTMTVSGGNGIFCQTQVAISSVEATIATGTSLLLLLRDNVNGGTALVLYENAGTPVIVSGSANFVLAAPTGTQIQLKNKSGNGGVSAVMAAAQSTTLNVCVISVDDS